MTQNVGFYKGVLICSRPGEVASTGKEKPFVGRVFAHEAIGLGPTRKLGERHEKKKISPVLNNHLKWLHGFQKKKDEKKELDEKKKVKQVKHLEKIKQEAHKIRENHIKSISQLKNCDENPQEKQQKKVEKKEENNKLSPKNHRAKNKNDKPAWAKSEKQVKEQEEKQVDDLLNFFESGQIKDYLGDEEISTMLKDLKDKISEMKKENEGDANWKKKQVKRLKEEKQQKKEKQENKKEDIVSKISRNSMAQSLATQKTVERIKQLQKEKEEKVWDKNTITDKQSHVSVDQQIAKNVADEILRNYPNLKHHSNQSIRKLLQKTAHEEIKK